MLITKKISIAFLVIFYCNASVVAQNSPYKTYTTNDGLVNNRTGCVAQDGAGYIWVGTDDGISCFDGRKFTFFPGKNNTFYYAHSYPTMYGDTVVMGTSGEGVAYCYKGKVRFESFNADKELRVISALGISDSSLLIASIQDKGFRLVKRQKGKKKSIELPKPVNIPTFISDVTDMYLIVLQDKDKNIWLGTDYGVVVYPKGNLKNPILVKSLSPNYINIITEDREGNICLASHTSIFIYKRGSDLNKDASFKEIALEEHYAGILSATYDLNNRLIIGYWNEYEYAVGYLKYKNGIPFIEKFGNYVAWYLFFDREENLWVATEDGVLKLNRLEIQNYLPELGGYPIASNGIVMNNGLFFSSMRDKRFLIGENSSQLIEPKSGSKIDYLGETIFQTSDNKLWFTNAYSESNNLQETRSLVIDKDGFSGGLPILQTSSFSGTIDFQIAYTIDDGNSFFRNVNKDINVYRNGKFSRVLSKNSSLSFTELRALIKGNANTLIALDANWGLVQLKVIYEGERTYIDTIQTLKIKEVIPELNQKQVLHLDKSGMLWIVSSRSFSVMRYVKDKNGRYRFHSKIKPKDLTSTSIRAIAEDSKGNIYLGSNQGIDKVRTSKDGSYVISKNIYDGYLTGKRVYFLLIHNDFLYVGTTGSFARVNLNQIKSFKKEPQIFITEFRIHNKNKNHYLDNKQNIRLNPSENTLQFTFLSTSFKNEKNVRYSYFLKGIDKQWSKPDVNYNASYSQLPSGKYTLYVKAINADGIWSSKPATFSFEILVPFYKSWWFISLIVLIVSAFIYWMYRFQLSKAIALERVRNKISKDLHDDVGSTLSSITLMNAMLRKKITSNPSEASSLAKKVEDTSRDMIQNISDIVWSTNPENDTFEKFIFRLQQFAGDIFEPKDIIYKIEFDKELLKKELPLNVKRDVYLICKEIMNNAAKYSEATSFTINFRLFKKMLIIDAMDNGKGFEETTIKQGNGIINIQQRAKKMIGNAIVNSENGVQWKIQIPL